MNIQNFSRRLFYPLAGVAALASCTGKVEKQKESKPLNIVYIMTDDHTRQRILHYPT